MEREHVLLIFLSMAQWMEHQHRSGFRHPLEQTVSCQLVQVPASRSKLQTSILLLAISKTLFL